MKWLSVWAICSVILPILAWGFPWGFAVVLGLLVLSYLSRNNAFVAVLSVLLTTASGVLATHELMLSFFGYLGFYAWIHPVIFLLFSVIIMLPTKEEISGQNVEP